MTIKQNCSIKRIKHCFREDIQNALYSLKEVADFEYDVYLKSKRIRIRLNDNEYFFISYKNYSFCTLRSQNSEFR